MTDFDVSNNELTGAVVFPVFTDSLVNVDISGNALLEGIIPADLCGLEDIGFDCSNLLCGCHCVCTGMNISLGSNSTG